MAGVDTRDITMSDIASTRPWQRLDLVFSTEDLGRQRTELSSSMESSSWFIISYSEISPHIDNQHCQIFSLSLFSTSEMLKKKFSEILQRNSTSKVFLLAESKLANLEFKEEEDCIIELHGSFLFLSSFPTLH